MVKHKHVGRRRAKIMGAGAAALVVGIGLLVLSQAIKPAEPAAPPATAPSSTTAPAERPPPLTREQAAAQQLSGLLILFGAASLLLFAILAGWLVVDIRSSRPAWKTQTKYPRRR